MERSRPDQTEVILSLPSQDETALPVSTRPYEEKRIAAIRKTWEARKEEILASIHTPESAAKNSLSQKKRLASNPDFLEKQRGLFKKARQAGSEQATQKREELFGGEIRAGLYEMHHSQGLTLEEIAHHTGYSESRIKKNFLENDLSYVKDTDPRSVRLFQRVQEALWTNPQAFQRLNPREKDVITKRFLSEGQLPTLHDVGEELGITKQRIDQIEKTALKNLTKE